MVIVLPQNNRGLFPAQPLKCNWTRQWISLAIHFGNLGLSAKTSLTSGTGMIALTEGSSAPCDVEGKTTRRVFTDS